ncbi:hypothetical protein [Vibrio quintilis]|uniref:hypothetical protein n=1 Tax=Vibrio quintilis TaxID=1117707 RepID=UPI00135633C1|nr:hypothetical protein [Vibrio quintilis]
MDPSIYEIAKEIGPTEMKGGKLRKKRREPETEECADVVSWARKSTIAGLRIGDY